MYSHKYLQAQKSFRALICSKTFPLGRGIKGKAKERLQCTGFSAKPTQAKNIPKGSSVSINLINKT